MRWLRSRPATPELCDPPAATGALDGACDPSAEAAGAMPAAVAGQLAEKMPEEEERHRLALAHLGSLQRRKTTASSRDPRLASRLSPLHTRLRRVASDLSPLSESEQRFLSEETLLRYLRARDGDEQRSSIASGSTLPRHVHHTSTGNEQLAFIMLEATLAWRRRHIAPACGEGGGLPRCEACEARADPRSHCFMRVGDDSRAAGRASNKTVRDNCMHMAFELERLFDGGAAAGRMPAT
ncbi:hypothetical protein EMIHUDRAFT_248933 [Emiliania huxleyi CCMP1516]|uniref:CRAL/TRIO N-terminal domain-containing protein n=2 Tax=Emiliania huxleyi TaxID=2903 RepID=A0A0D3IC96_EMIH1|nr:hypothetical protein EMIHUDRAFT_248933 [Emiliania huxleyi CCMP1516]EOD08881.1 hypothetical protein EMIHUDRAFT_248933 [Emiliania huxleyi CCMP1516]|eukprot:XP_005761310.1 hypothetical protein EMIHUDRAFT_248933 [Emiliania huxleyi CCMP1516]